MANKSVKVSELKRGDVFRVGEARGGQKSWGMWAVVVRTEAEGSRVRVTYSRTFRWDDRDVTRSLSPDMVVVVRA